MGCYVEMGYLNPYQAVQSNNTTEMGWILNGIIPPTFDLVHLWALDAAKRGSTEVCWQILNHLRAHPIKMGVYESPNYSCPSGNAKLTTIKSWRRTLNNAQHLFSKYPTSYDICVLQGNCAMLSIVGKKEELALSLIKGAIFNPFQLVKNLSDKSWLEEKPLLLSALGLKVRKEKHEKWLNLWSESSQYVQKQRSINEHTVFEKEFAVAKQKSVSRRL